MEIVPLEIARANGLVRYYDGVPCQNGHSSGRYVKSGVCVGCASGRIFRHTARKKAKAQTITLDILVPSNFDLAAQCALRDHLQFTAIPAYIMALNPHWPAAPPVPLLPVKSTP